MAQQITREQFVAAVEAGIKATDEHVGFTDDEKQAIREHARTTDATVIANFHSRHEDEVYRCPMSAVGIWQRSVYALLQGNAAPNLKVWSFIDAFDGRFRDTGLRGVVEVVG